MLKGKLLEVEEDVEAEEIIDVVASRVRGAIDVQGGKVVLKNLREVRVICLT